MEGEGDERQIRGEGKNERSRGQMGGGTRGQRENGSCRKGKMENGGMNGECVCGEGGQTPSTGCQTKSHTNEH